MTWNAMLASPPAGGSACAPRERARRAQTTGDRSRRLLRVADGGAVVARSARDWFSWRRWWCPAAEDPPVSSGFLDDPAGLFATYFDYSLIELAQLDHVRCLVLLGEAGMGKSSELDVEKQRLREARLPVAGFDLGTEPDISLLRDTVLTSPEVTAWLAGAYDLVMLLDGFDEANASLAKLPDQLINLLDGLPTGRLKLRITSRTGLWSPLLDAGLADRWPDLQRHVLAPLTEEDVRVAAHEALGDGSAFVSAVRDRDLGALAARPLTLRMLMTVQRDDGALPIDRIDLYDRAVKVLARENHERRIEEPSSPDHPVDERLRAARRLAAVSIVSGRTVIHPKRMADTPDSDLALDDITRTRQEMAILLEVLSSGLITSAAGGGVRWTHRSVGEFLAAQTLAGLPVATTGHLLSSPFAPEQVVPQLAGVATWVAALRPEVYRWLADREPGLLLTANLATTTDEQRRILGRTLLRQLDGDEPPHDRRYFLLTWEGMAADIEPYLTDHRPVWVRREATRLLSDSGCRDLDERLTEVIEDIASRHPVGYLGQEIGLASTMVFALDGCDDPELMDRLTAVAGDSDTPWQLRSDILAELWRRLPVDELLSLVEGMNLPGQNPEFGSAVATSLSTATRRGQLNLQSLLDWLDTLDFRDSGGFSDDWQQVVEAAAILAAQSDDLDDARWTIVARLTHGWLERAAQLFTWHDADVRALPIGQRRRLASAILRRYPDSYTAHHLGRESGLVIDDREWWLSELAKFDLATALRLDAPLQDVTSEAAGVGQEHRRQRDAADGEKAAAHFDSQCLASAIDALDWPTTARELRLPVDRHRWAAGAPLTMAPGWLTLDAATKAAIIDVADSFLGGLPAEPVKDLIDAAADAFAIVASEDPSRYTWLDPDVLLAWLKAIWVLPWHDEAVIALVHRLAETRHNEVEQLLLEGIAEDGTHLFPVHLRRLGGFGSPKIADALSTLARDRNTTAPVVEAALATLVERAPDRGVTTAFDMVDRRPAVKPSRFLTTEASDEDVGRRWWQSVHACAALIKSARCADNLDAILSGLTASPEFAADVITAAQPDGSGHEPWPALSSNQLATLYLWADNTLPHEPDHPHGAIIDVNPVSDFGGQVYRRLSKRVDRETVVALNRIADELGDPWPRTTAASIVNALRETQWEAPHPVDVRDIVDDPARRIVTTEAQMAALLLEAIDQLGIDVRQNPDVAGLFWHQQLQSGWIPRWEKQFTTLLTERIQAKLDGVVLRQEVQLNLHYADTAGAEPDIEAIVLHSGAEISVFVEVKGIWHGEVKTAIQQQLADRYLTGARSLTGIYLVAAFASEHWVSADRRRAKARKHDPDTLRQFLEDEAERLSTDGKAVHVRVVPFKL